MGVCEQCNLLEKSAALGCSRAYRHPPGRGSIDAIYACGFRNADQATHRLEMDLLGARQIVRSLAPLKGLTGDDAEIVARIIAQSFAEGHQRVAASPSEGWRNE